MIPLKDYIDGLRLAKSQPVSFRLHTAIGNILSNVDDNINNTDQDEKVLPTSENITLLL
jgi:hypothetical protein